MSDLDHRRFETWQQQQQATAEKREAFLQLFSVFLRDLLILADRLLERAPPGIGLPGTAGALAVAVEPDPPAAPARRARVPPRPWTAKEDALLRRDRHSTMAALSAQLGRSVRSVTCRRARLRRHKLWGGRTKAPQKPPADKAEGEPGAGRSGGDVRLVQVRTDLVTVIGLAVAKRLAARAEHRAAIRKRVHDLDSWKPHRDERRACMLHLLDLELARRDEMERMMNVREAAMRDA